MPVPRTRNISTPLDAPTAALTANCTPVHPHYYSPRVDQSPAKFPRLTRVSRRHITVFHPFLMHSRLSATSGTSKQFGTVGDQTEIR